MAATVGSGKLWITSIPAAIPPADHPRSVAVSRPPTNIEALGKLSGERS
jgi:hypothetical protein